jgi:hypothetical protein
MIKLRRARARFSPALLTGMRRRGTEAAPHQFDQSLGLAVDGWRAETPNLLDASQT